MAGGPSIRPDRLPGDVEPYRTIGPYDAASLPSGLRKTHRLAEGVWGLLELESGSIAFIWEGELGGAAELTAPARLVVPPQVPHRVSAEGPFSLTITFHRAEPKSETA